MSCYTRHLGDVLAAAGVENTKDNRKKIDCYLKDKYKLPQHASSCPDVWKSHVKPMLANDKQKMELIVEINKLFNK